MTLISESVTALNELSEEIKNLSTGHVPSVWKLLSIQGKILDLYTRLGEEQSRLFSAKEKSYLARKIAAAEQHRKGRLDLKLTSKDAEQSALLAVGEEMNVWPIEGFAIGFWRICMPTHCVISKEDNAGTDGLVVGKFLQFDGTSAKMEDEAIFRRRCEQITLPMDRSWTQD